MQTLDQRDAVHKSRYAGLCDPCIMDQHSLLHNGELQMGHTIARARHRHFTRLFSYILLNISRQVHQLDLKRVSIETLGRL